MSGKLSAVSAAKEETLRDDYAQAAEGKAESGKEKEIEESLVHSMHTELATAMAHLLYKHYKVETVALAILDEPEKDLWSGIRVLFKEDIELSGRERLEILDNLSRFLADLSKAVEEEDGVIIDAATGNSIFDLIYDPVIFGNALIKLTLDHAPNDMQIGEHLHDAAVFLERVGDYVPAHKLN